MVWGSQWHVRASVAIRPAQPEGCNKHSCLGTLLPPPLSRRAAMANLGATSPAAGATGPAGAGAPEAAFAPAIPARPVGQPGGPWATERHPVISEILTVTLDINDGIRALLASGDRMGHRMMIQGAEQNLRAALTTLQGIRDAIAEVQPGQPAQPGQPKAAPAEQPAQGTLLLPPPPPGPPPAGAAGPKAPPPGVTPGMAGIPAHLVAAPPAQPAQPVQPQEFMGSHLSNSNISM